MKKIKKFIEKYGKAIVPITAVMLGAFIMIAAGVNNAPKYGLAEGLVYMQTWGWFGFFMTIAGIVLPFVKFKGR